MLYSLCSDGNFRIGFSEIEKIDGIEQIRIFAAEPWAGHRGFKLLEFYIPSKKITYQSGYSDEEARKLTEWIGDGVLKDSAFENAREYETEPQDYNYEMSCDWVEWHTDFDDYGRRIPLEHDEYGRPILPRPVSSPCGHK